MLKIPFLQFDFFNLNTKKQEQIIFENPIKVIQTTDIDKINKVLEEVELAVHNGYYAAGFLSYEATQAFLPVDSFSNSKFPLIWFGIFDSPTKLKAKINHSFTVGDWNPNIDKETYLHDFKKIEDAFNLGLTEQVNYTMQLNADFKGDSYAYYNALKKEQDADYNSYISFDDFRILSLSPELFFDLNKDVLTVKPMKGTKERGKDKLEDQLFKKALQSSTKDKLENKLIVDLMIDELKSISITDSIKVKKHFEIETYPTLFQMTSTIEALIKPKRSLTDIFNALFPCGSITGTPKVDTINFINKLENRNRQIYCGAIGFITPEKEATFSVPIRTVSIDVNKKQARYDVGGGITKLSNANDEYNEVFTKAKILDLNKRSFELIESFGLYQGSYVAFEAHLKRLQLSAKHFNFELDLEEVKKELSRVASANQNQNLRVRLLLAANGSLTLSSVPLIKDEKTKLVSLAKSPINITNEFLYHKTTNRTVYNELKADFPNYFDVILWNNQDELTEFTIGNLVIEYENELITPPISSGLLPGTYREILLESKQIKERIITKSMLQKTDQVWLINSVRKWVKVTLKKAAP